MYMEDTDALLPLKPKMFTGDTKVEIDYSRLQLYLLGWIGILLKDAVVWLVFLSVTPVVLTVGTSL